MRMKQIPLIRNKLYQKAFEVLSLLFHLVRAGSDLFIKPRSMNNIKTLLANC